MKKIKSINLYLTKLSPAKFFLFICAIIGALTLFFFNREHYSNSIYDDPSVLNWSQLEKIHLSIFENFLLNKTSDKLPLPDINLRPEPIKLTDLIDQKIAPITIVHFWASWCPPCQKELPSLLLFSSQHANYKFIFVLVDDVPQKAQHYLLSEMLKLNINPNKSQIIFSVANGQNLQEAIHLFKRPETIMVHQSKKFIRRFQGAVDWEINF